MTRLQYFRLVYRVYRANAHGVVAIIKLAARDALERFPT